MEQKSHQNKLITINLTIADIVKRSIIALWLGFLYILCTALVMSSLSGSLFQDKLSKIPKPEKATKSPIQVSNEKIMGPNGEWLIKEGIRSVLKSENSPTTLGTIDTYESMVAESVNNLIKEINKTVSYYNLNEIIAAHKVWTQASSSDILRYSQLEKSKQEELVNDLNMKFKADEERAQLLENKIKELKVKLDGPAADTTSSTNTTFDKQQLGSFENELGWLKRALLTKKATLDFIIINKDDPKTIPRFLEVDKFNSFFSPIKNILSYVTIGTLTDDFWAYPRPILKLNLIFSMGILGSLIFVTIEFIRDPSKHSLEMYFFRPFLGMIIALAMYVMIKSGQSTLFDDTERDLSPFFISFLGIISGMLAEQAYRRISFTGESLFTAGTNGNTPPDTANSAASTREVPQGTTGKAKK